MLALFCVLSQARHHLRGISTSESLDEIHDLLRQAALEEEDDQPKDGDVERAYEHYEALYKSCSLNLAEAIECIDSERNVQDVLTLALPVEPVSNKIRGIGKRMAVCSILEVDAEKFFAPIRAFTSILAKPLTVTLDFILGVIAFFRNLIRGKFGAVADQIVEFLHLNPASKLMSFVGDLIYVVGRCFTDVDVKATFCALCAAALSHALSTNNDDNTGPILSPDDGTNPVREIQQALTYSYRYKTSPDRDNNICALDPTALDEMSAVVYHESSKVESIQQVLRHVSESYVRQTRAMLTLEIRRWLQHPFESLSELSVTERELIEKAAHAIMHPSTEIDVPTSQGGFEITDLTKFYFTGGVEPKLETLSLRQCGRVCKPVNDLRTCSTDCRKCECTIA